MFTAIRPRLAILVFGILTGACSPGGTGEPVIIGSKIDAASRLLGERVAQHLERAGCSVERRFDLGDARATDASLRSGEIDAYVESQRVALTEVLGEPEPQSLRIETVLRPLYVNRGLFWSPPLGSRDLAVVYRRDVDRKCRQASRAIMKLAYVAESSNSAVAAPAP